MHKLLVLLGLGLFLLHISAPALAADQADSRMDVELHAADVPPKLAKNILTDIPGMAKLGILELWNRLVPQDRVADVHGADAMALLQRAVPMDDGGLKLVFNHDRVTQYLNSLGITYPAEPPHFNLQITMINPAGVSMPQSEAALLKYSSQNATKWGYVIDDKGDPLDLSWRWLTDKQVSLTIEGNPRLTAMQSIRFMASGDPMPQIEAWLDEVMLDARDAYDVQPTTTPANARNVPPPSANLPVSGATSLVLVLTVVQPATLAEQIVFEQALSGDTHVESLQLSRVDANSRQYLLHLRHPGADWLPAWFASHGMQATLTNGGWIAQ